MLADVHPEMSRNFPPLPFGAVNKQNLYQSLVGCGDCRSVFRRMTFLAIWTLPLRIDEILNRLLLVLLVIDLFDYIERERRAIMGKIAFGCIRLKFNYLHSFEGNSFKLQDSNKIQAGF